MPQPIGFLLVSASYPPIVGGSEIEAQRVAKALIQDGYRGLVVCEGGDPMPDQRHWIDPQGIPVRIYGNGPNRPWRNRIYALGVVWTLWEKRREYQVAYFLMQGLQLALGMPVAKLLGKAIVVKIAGSNVIPILNRSWIGRLELWMIRKWAYRLMILNDGMIQEGLDHGFQREQMIWMPNPVDTEEFRPSTETEKLAARRQLGIGEHRKVAMFVGRMVPEKELKSLVAGFGRVAQEDKDRLLVLVGDGPEREEAEKLGKQLAPDQILFTGRVGFSEVKTYLAAADCFVLVSHSEGFPCAMVEAMASGLAVVASRIPANEQLIVDGKTGLLTEVGNADSIAVALRRILSNRQEREQFAALGCDYVKENFSTNTVAGMYKELFKNAVEAG